MTSKFTIGEKPEHFGRHFIVGVSGPEIAEVDKRILGSLKPAGILLLKRNFSEGPYPVWLSKLKQLLSDIHSYSERDHMIISIDHEGGHVMRTPAPITAFPYATFYANHAAAVAEAMAIELRSIGVNLSWAPVADIHSNPRNPIIGERAFGTTAEEVSLTSAEFTKALMKNGLVACAKHFPGHGDTHTDSHLELPVLNLTEAELLSRELIPFKALISIGVPCIMTAHIHFPKIDANCPATYSDRILRGILREKFSYEGVVISDDLEMKAVAKAFLQPEPMAQALNAGCDMFIVAGNPKPDAARTIAYAGFIAQCFRKNLIAEKTLYAAYLRIEQLFAEKLQKSAVAALTEDVFRKHAELKNSLPH